MHDEAGSTTRRAQIVIATVIRTGTAGWHVEPWCDGWCVWQVDLDLGNYERFEGVTLSRDHNITTGKVYNEVIMRERRGDYLGKTVQVVPHITDEIQVGRW